MKIALAIVGLCVVCVVLLFVLRKPKLVDKSFATYSGAVVDYSGDKKLVVAFTASWASVWKVTAQEFKKLNMQKFDLCILDASVDQDEVRSFGVTFLPTVALIEMGRLRRKYKTS